MTASPAPALPPARRLGYRLLGRNFDYLLHMRPAEWPIMGAHTALGYLLAVGLGGALAGERLGAAAAGIALWVVALNGGTLAINSAFDRDEGDIGYLRAPPPVPRHLAVCSLALMAAGQGLALLLPPAFAAAYAVCFLMSLLYSVPPIRLKAVAGADWLINMLGFGSLTPVAGFALTARPFEAHHWLLFGAFCPLFAALYPLTQLYQFEEDRRRGDRTLALILGMQTSLRLAVGATLAGFALFALAGLRSGWRLGPGDLVRWSGLVLALAGWLIVLLPWLARHRIMKPEEHQRGMYRALGAWALTDIVVILVWAL